MVYYCNWISLVVVSLWVSVVAFFWALQTGQFSEQDRARYLPLAGERFPAREPPRYSRPQAYALGGILILGMALFIIPLILTLKEMMK